MNTIKFRITNLECEACVRLSTMALQKIPGVNKVDINLSDGISSLENDQKVDWQTIKIALEDIGKTAVLFN